MNDLYNMERENCANVIRYFPIIKHNDVFRSIAVSTECYINRYVIQVISPNFITLFSIILKSVSATSWMVSRWTLFDTISFSRRWSRKRHRLGRSPIFFLNRIIYFLIHKFIHLDVLYKKVLIYLCRKSIICIEELISPVYILTLISHI